MIGNSLVEDKDIQALDIPIQSEGQECADSKVFK